MASATISYEQLEQDYSAAEEAAHTGPVFITRNGTPTTVLLDVAQYRKLAPEPTPPSPFAGRSLADLLAVPEEEYFEWEPPRMKTTFEDPETPGPRYTLEELCGILAPAEGVVEELLEDRRRTKW